MKRCCLLFGIALSLLVTACNKGGKDPDGLVKVSYQATDELITNPERGFYSGTSFESEDGSAVTASQLNANRRLGRSLFMLECWLKPFFESDISEAYLELIRKSLKAYRGTGVKCILRFGYSDHVPGNDLSNWQKYLPYDATEEQILRHIAQIKPILQEYSDVIYVLQAGFIGCWGEWYYTDHFNTSLETAADYAGRKRVCDALLDALPSNRQVSLRTPAYKQGMYGFTLADTLTLAQAHQPTEKARLGGHNDCFLASSNDQGTFLAPSGKEYWCAESRYTIMGGETCALSTFCKCDNTLKNMTNQHYSYLNISFDKDVINFWSKNNCLNEIKSRLGYRLLLTEAFFGNNPAAGEPYRVVLNIRNDGFAALMNPRDAELVLSDQKGNVVKTWKLESDPRTWMPATTTSIDQTITLPTGLSGEYTLSLNLPDAAETLHDDPLYSVRLANEDVWDKESGFNNLYKIKL